MLVQPLKSFDENQCPDTEQFGTLLSHFIEKQGKDLPIDYMLTEMSHWLRKNIDDKDAKWNSKKVFALLTQRLLTDSSLHTPHAENLYRKFQMMLLLEQV